MEKIKKILSKDKDGFNGNYKIVNVSTENEIVKNFLKDHNDDTGMIYNTIKNNINHIMIIEHFNIEKEYQGKGYGSFLIKKILNQNDNQVAILVANVLHEQRFGFNLEKFYELHDFKTIDVYQDYPLMMYPSQCAKEISFQIEKMKK